MIGLRLHGAGGRAAAFTVDNCEFIQAQPGVEEKRLVSLEAAAGGRRPRRLEPDGVPLPEFHGMLEGDSAGQRRRLRRRRRRGARRPRADHGVRLRLRAARARISAFKAAGRCRRAAADARPLLGAGGRPVHRVRRAARRRRRSELPRLPVLPSGRPPARRRTARPHSPGRPRADVACQDNDSRYPGLDALLGGRRRPRSNGPPSKLGRSAVAKPSSVLTDSPWNAADPLQPFRQIQFPDADREDHFVAAFQVKDSRPNLRRRRGQDLAGRRAVAGRGELRRRPGGGRSRRPNWRCPSGASSIRGRSDSANRSLHDAGGGPVGVANPATKSCSAATGCSRVEPIRLDKKNLQDVTIRPEAGRHPVLQLTAAQDRDAEPAMFRVYDGKLRLEGLEFVLQPDDGSFRPASADRSGRAGPVHPHELPRHAGRPSRPSTRLAAAWLSDPGKAMMQSTRPPTSRRS